MIEGGEGEREEERELPHALIRYLPCVPMLADVLFFWHAANLRSRAWPVTFRCHVKMGTPYFGDPGSLYLYKNGDSGPYNHKYMHGDLGSPYLYEYGDPTMILVVKAKFQKSLI